MQQVPANTAVHIVVGLSFPYSLHQEALSHSKYIRLSIRLKVGLHIVYLGGLVIAVHKLFYYYIN